MPKTVTIDSLAMMIQKGFLAADEKLEEFRRETVQSFYEIDLRFDMVERRLDKVENRLDKVETKLDVIVLELRGHDRRITSLETAILSV